MVCRCVPVWVILAVSLTTDTLMILLQHLDETWTIPGWYQGGSCLLIWLEAGSRMFSDGALTALKLALGWSLNGFESVSRMVPQYGSWMVPHWWLQSWFSDGAPMAASPTLRPIPGGRQVPEDGGVKGRDFGCSTLWLFHTLSYCLTWQNGCLQSLDENISVNLIHLNYSEDIHRRQRTGRLSRTWWHFPMLCSSINWVEMSGSPKIQTLHWSLIVFDVLNSESTMALEIPISDFLGKAFLCYAQASTEWKWVGRQRSRHCLATTKKKKDIVWPRRHTPLSPGR